MAVFGLARIVGSGKGDDVYRPAGVDNLTEWTMIDLRPPGQLTGWCLVGAPETPRGAIRIGDDPTTDSPAARKVLQNQLGVNLSGTHLGRQILGLLLEGREDGSRWKPLKPTKAGVWEVWLGNERLDVLPVVSGGATAVTDNYNRADGALGGGWGTTGGSQTIHTNRHRVGGIGGAVHGTALDSSDMETSVTLNNISGASLAGTLVRVPIATHDEAYWGYTRNDAGDERRIYRLSGNVVGTDGSSHAASLAFNGDRASIGSRIATRADGSTITFIDDDDVILTATDTVIPGNFGHGVRGFQSGAMFFDDYLARILGTGWRVGSSAL